MNQVHAVEGRQKKSLDFSAVCGGPPQTALHPARAEWKTGFFNCKFDRLRALGQGSTAAHMTG
ncbi:hypothetical protein M2345_001498 [Sphingobium sp. B8D3D]|nr:hypothetical protein [Sphingobium sp. B8D3D]MCW2415966.1 hypothetical protein [Sphingobium sp. B8D3A]